MRTALDEINWKGTVRSNSIATPLKGLSLAGCLLVAIQFVYMFEMNAWAGSPPSPKNMTMTGNAERGRAVFNGKGV